MFRGNRSGEVREWMVGAGILAALLLALVGLGWYVGSQLPTAPAAEPELAIAEPPAQNEPEQHSVQSSRLLSDAGHPPIQDKPVVQKQPEARNPPSEQQPSTNQSPPRGLREFPLVTPADAAANRRAITAARGEADRANASDKGFAAIRDVHGAQGSGQALLHHR